ncbi:MAG: hypothetical protein ACXWVT_02320 [Burkholderiaceae bacterium]
MDDRPHWLDEPRNVKRLWRGFVVVLVLAVLAETVVTFHPHFAVESLFGFNAWFGFLACVAMIVVAKALGVLLKRPDTYYGGRDE